MIVLVNPNVITRLFHAMRGAAAVTVQWAAHGG